MTVFEYVAKGEGGAPQKGLIEAASQQAAVLALTEKKLKPISVKPQKSSLKKLFAKLNDSSKVKSKDLVIFTRQLATMINAGVPLVRSLATMQGQTESKALKKALDQIVAKVEGGIQLSEAMKDYPKIFSDVYINMVEAGEAGGILDQIMERLATQVEKENEIKGKLKSAMIYPMVITFVTFGAFIFLMTGIIPKLSKIFEQFGSELPLQTRIMLGISNFMIHNSVLLVIINVVLVVLFIKIIHTPKGKYIFDTILLKLPIFGVIILKVNVARFSRTFSSLTNAGVSVLDGLTVTSGSVNNSVIKRGIVASVEKVRNGQPISQSLEESGVFPPIVIQMTSVGEETGQVDVVLEKVADFYEKEVDRVVAGLTSIIEPLLIVVLGGVVGLIASSVFGPISNLTQAI